MNFQFYLEKLYDSESFQKFRMENPKTYACSAFFTFDFTNLKNPDDKQHFDFCIPESDKIFSFMIEKGCELTPIENVSNQELSRIDLNYEFDFDGIKEMIRLEMEKREITNKIEKILISLQNFKNEDCIVGTVFISGLGMIKIGIDIATMKFTDFEKKSFLDIVNVFKKPKKE